MNLTSKALYLIESALNYFKPSVCTYCGNKDLKVIDRKYLITKLAECTKCKLRLRLPTDKDIKRDRFYNGIYKQKGITTDLPSHDELQCMLESKFESTVRNIDTSKKIMTVLAGPLADKSILDFGCSWGYMTWQFKQLGMNVQGFEISKDRAEYGNQHLGIDIVTDKADLRKNFDFVFSSHVIEHLNDIDEYVNMNLQKLNNEGFVVILCPNGSDDLLQGNFAAFHNFWGQVHPNMLSSGFYANVFEQNAYYIASSPYNFDEIAAWDQKSKVISLKGGDELLCIVKKAHT
jgi:2-polyprenyl-3-methyl-5-hydroxy-6-metoxy-1,4-benzoquinol methylase